jgi:hypothetical protein
VSIFGAPTVVTAGASFPPDPSVSAPFNTAVGDVIVVFCAFANGTTDIACSDAAGNEYEPQGEPITSPGGINVQMWTSIATEAMEGNTVSVGGTSGGELRGAIVWDFPVSGGAASLDVIQATSVTPSASPMPTAPFDLAGDDEIVVVGLQNDGASPASAQEGFTLDVANLTDMSAEHGAFAAPQTGFVAEMTMEFGPQTGVIIAAAFKAGGTPPPPTGTAQPVVVIM